MWTQQTNAPNQTMALQPQSRPLGGRERRDILNKKKTAAKTGMAVSLGVLVGTSLMDGDKARLAHICSGAALLGFSIWHYTLYKR